MRRWRQRLAAFLHPACHFRCQCRDPRYRFKGLVVVKCFPKKKRLAANSRVLPTRRDSPRAAGGIGPAPSEKDRAPQKAEGPE